MRRPTIVVILLESAALVGFSLVLQRHGREWWPLPTFLAVVAVLNLGLAAIALRRRRQARADRTTPRPTRTA